MLELPVFVFQCRNLVGPSQQHQADFSLVVEHHVFGIRHAVFDALAASAQPVFFLEHPFSQSGCNQRSRGAAKGKDLRHVAAKGLNLDYLLRWHALFKQHNEVFFNAPAFMDKLAGTDQLRLQIEQGLSQTEIRASWQAELQQFRQQRQPYLLYPP